MKIDKTYLDNLLIKAYDEAKERHHYEVTLEHIFLSALKDDKFKLFITSFGKYDALVSDVENILKNEDQYPINKQTSEIKIKDDVIAFIHYIWVVYASLQDLKCQNDDLTMSMTLLASFLFNDTSNVWEILIKNDITLDIVVDIYQSMMSQTLVQDRISPNIQNFVKEATITNESALKKYTTDLTEKVKNDWIKIVGRENELDILSQMLCRRDKPNVIMVGNPGIGKTKIVEALANKFNKEDKGVKIYQLDFLSFTSNIMFKGEIEKRTKQLVDELIEVKDCILFIDEIHSICGNGSDTIDVANLLKPLMSSNKLKIIGTTTFEEYRKYIEKDDAFSRRFYKMVVEDSTYDDTVKVLKEIAPFYAQYFHIKYTKKALDEIMELTNRYIFDKHYPYKAIDILDVVGAYCVHNGLKKATEKEVRITIGKMLNIPLDTLSIAESDLYKHLEEKLLEKIYGQEEAVKSVSNAVIVSRCGLREASKTAISLMFKGSSGCGKTQLCQTLAETLNIPLIRFDMSEYMEEHSVSKLIGAPPGYKDAGNGKSGNGLLINAIDEHPHCVLLLDEIEKANSKIHNLLLQVMDNGMLTSSLGKKISFENVFLIMTSNVGSRNIGKMGIGFGSGEYEDNDYQDSFLPEFRNRLDKTITFKSLNKDVMKKICNKFLSEMSCRLKIKGLELEYEDDVISYIVKKSMLINEGAREMKNIINEEITNEIAYNIAWGNYRNNKIKIKIKEEKIVIEG